FLFVSDWQHKLRLILTAVVLMQFIVLLDIYWKEITVSLVQATIVIVVFCEFISRIHPFIRRASALILVLYYHFSQLGGSFSDVIMTRDIPLLFSSIETAIVNNYQTISPYIWFSLVSGMTVIILTDLLKHKVRIILF